MRRLPTAKPREVVTALRKAGFVEHHQRGSHLYLWHPTKRRMTAVPMHPGDLHRGLLKRILIQASLTEDQFRALL